jgi:hypothetical protein
MIARSLTALAMTLLLAAPAIAQEEPPPPAAPAPEAPPPAVAPAAAAPAAAVGKRFAQPGILEIGGGVTFGYDYYETIDYKSFNLGLSPYVLYFVMKGLSVGGKFQVDYQKIWSGDGNGDATSIAIMPAAEYNFDLGSRIFPYAGLAFGYGYMKSGDVKINQFRFVPEGGVKITFGSGGAGGILGLGLQVPVILHAPDVEGADTYTQAGFAVVTRYAVFF